MILGYTDSFQDIKNIIIIIIIVIITTRPFAKIPLWANGVLSGLQFQENNRIILKRENKRLATPFITTLTNKANEETQAYHRVPWLNTKLCHDKLFHVNYSTIFEYNTETLIRQLQNYTEILTSRENLSTLVESVTATSYSWR